MGYKLTICLMLFLMTHHSIAFYDVDGVYADSHGNKIEISQSKNEYSLSVGGVTESFENRESNYLSHCLMFYSLDILIPKKFSLVQTFNVQVLR